jgi:hypothetical protein
MAATQQSRIAARAAASVATAIVKCFCKDPIGNEYALSQSGPIKATVLARKACRS